ncbi:MAG: peptidoglycan editing factor PgeF [Gammaproteobacteria bacterium]|nr:MAG: peptidoglycan editing factor PgeF [Gammaproteobacteria bacterium]
MTARHWIRADWPLADTVVAGTTLRNGGISSGCYASLNLGAGVGDLGHAVEENRRRWRELCQLPAAPAWLRQVHGTRVVTDPATAGCAADAIVSRRAGVVCAVLSADCLPVLFAAADGSEVAAAHAGWRGLCAGVLEATIASMAARPLLAWFGPAISGAAFEVGPEVRSQFLAHDPQAADCFTANERGRWQADLCELARMRLRQAGVTRVFGGDRCTVAEPEAFFSYRRDGECGRMATFIFRKVA